MAHGKRLPHGYSEVEPPDQPPIGDEGLLQEAIEDIRDGGGTLTLRNADGTAREEIHAGDLFRRYDEADRNAAVGRLLGDIRNA